MARSVRKTKTTKSPTKGRKVVKKSPEYIEIKIDESVVKLVGIIVLGILGVVALLVYGKRTDSATLKVEQGQQVDKKDGPVTVESVIGDSPVLGKKDAPVVVFEYGDYECPFCRRHDTQTFPELKKEYIDTGKVKYVAKNFIAVPSHKPSALPAAYAAMCVYKVAGNDAFWKFREELVKAFDSGEYGIPADAGKRLSSAEAVKTGLRKIAQKVGVDLDKYDSCIKDNSAVEKMFNEDQNYVISKIAPYMEDGVGTPMFVVCKASKDDNTPCKGTVIMGAYPFETFKQTIDSLLENK